MTFKMKTLDLALWMKRRIWLLLRSWVSSAVAYKKKKLVADVSSEERKANLHFRDT